MAHRCDFGGARTVERQDSGGHGGAPHFIKHANASGGELLAGLVAVAASIGRRGMQFELFNRNEHWKRRRGDD